MSGIPSHSVLTLPKNHMMQMFSDNEIATKTMILAATLAAAFFSFQVLPPPMNVWTGFAIILTGAIHLAFGGFSRASDFISPFFFVSVPVPDPDPYPRTYPSRTVHYHRVPHGVYGSGSSSYRQGPSVSTDSFSSGHPHRVRTSEGSGYVHSHARHSGTRPFRKDTSHLEHKETDLSKSWHPGSFSTPVHGHDGSTGQLHGGFKKDGRRPTRKEWH